MEQYFARQRTIIWSSEPDVRQPHLRHRGPLLGETTHFEGDGKRRIMATVPLSSEGLPKFLLPGQERQHKKRILHGLVPIESGDLILRCDSEGQTRLWRIADIDETRWNSWDLVAVPLSVPMIWEYGNHALYNNILECVSLLYRRIHSYKRRLGEHPIVSLRPKEHIGSSRAIWRTANEQTGPTKDSTPPRGGDVYTALSPFATHTKPRARKQ